jgi:hypothetical protein
VKAVHVNFVVFLAGFQAGEAMVGHLLQVLDLLA